MSSNMKNALSEEFDALAAMGKETSGILTTKQIEEAGIYRGKIASFIESGWLIRESKGVYSISSEQPDEYAILQKRSAKMIFSYGTALYLWGMSDRIPHLIDVTFPQGYNASRIKKNNPKIKFHYVHEDKWGLGITETTTSLGNAVKLYDRERCICDLILIKKQVDKQLYIQALREYFSGKQNVRKLIKYAKVFGIEDKVRDYMEVLTW